MDYKRLLDEHRIEPVEMEQFSTNLAEKDLISAKNSFSSRDYDWAISIAYNSVLRASRSFMQSRGFRAIGKEHHKNVFEFLRESCFDKDLVDFFDNIRKRRNNFLYGVLDGASKKDAKEVILAAEDFVHKIRTFVHKIRTR